MPEVYFRVEWPNGTISDCYSPSTAIEQYLKAGETYGPGDFLMAASQGLTRASERVRVKFGYACSSALDQLARLRASVAELSTVDETSKVKVLAISRRPFARHPKEHFPVVIVGAGHAGLSVSYHLKERGIAHVLLEKSRVGSSWSDARWDTFCLVTPNWQCRLPGYPYSGSDPKGFMKKDEILAYIAGYRGAFEPPVREGVEVTRLQRSGHGEGFELVTSAGTILADQVVIATGVYHKPRIPAFSAELPADVVQLDASRYRNPEQLPEGEVLVVGTGQSGCQIAEDLHRAGRRVHLCVGNAPRCARFYRGRDVVEWLELMGYYEIPYDRHPDRDQLRDKTNHYVTGRDGGHDIDLRRFAVEGMKLYGPLADIRAGELRFAPGLKAHLDDADDTYRRINRSIDSFIEQNGIEAPPRSEYMPVWEPTEEPEVLASATANIRSVVWCTGFESDFAWVELPVFDEHGRAVHERGVTAVPGVYFIGLPWQYTWGSGRLAGVARDSEYLLAHISALQARREPARARSI